MEQPNSSIGEKFKQDVEGAACDIKARSGSVLHNEKTRLINGLNGVVNALDESARQLRQNNDPNIASYLELASDKLDQAGQYLENAGVQDVLRDVGTMARRNPFAVFGGMFLAGIGLARIVKNASSEESENTGIDVPAPRTADSRPDPTVVRHFQAS